MSGASVWYLTWPRGAHCPPCHSFGTCSTNWQIANNLTDHSHHIAESTRELLLPCEELRVQVVWRGATKLATISKRRQLYDFVAHRQYTSHRRTTADFSG